ncbi:MAG TPA: uracil-DNA glycosylase [Blastocatellia bacterium]|jgi:uracil-DNA glycosylase family 4|nr:uracil-DNA glycosylase [Blastocatellia bacterium]
MKREDAAIIIKRLQGEMVDCFRCPRLVEWREQVSREKVRRFLDEEYWGRPVPSFGDPSARLLVVGLAPAAHGGNRTGRVFTGDRSGDWLYRALHRAGFANQPTSTHIDDGLELRGCYISAVIHCAPPANKPLPEEVMNCRPFLLREIEALVDLSVVVALGKIAFDAAFNAFAAISRADGSSPDDKRRARGRPAFGHGAEFPIGGAMTLLGSYHPSQQNTFTGKLTEPMLDAVFSRAREIIESKESRSG